MLQPRTVSELGSVLTTKATDFTNRAENPALARKLQLESSQVKLLITRKAFCIVQRATAQSKTGIFRDYGVAKAPPGFQVGWSDCMYFSTLSVHFVCSSGFSV
jgi:hypothetical protein